MELNDLYQDVVSRRNKVEKEIKVLEADENVKKYFELQEQNLKLIKEERSLYTSIMYEKYSSCNHIWVRTLFEGHTNGCDGLFNDYYSCIKCGLDYRVLNTVKGLDNHLEYLSLEEKIMFDYIKQNEPMRKKRSTYIHTLCDIDLAKALYKYFKKEYPNMDDNTILVLFENELERIRNSELQNKEITSKYIKKLSLNPNFNKWTERSAMKINE